MDPTLLVDSSDGARLVVTDLGGDGPPVLLAHATGFCGSVWRPLVSELGPARAWTFDFRGHGRSSAPPAHAYSWDGFASDVLAVVEAAGLEGAVGVGHSMGGAALLLAEARAPGTFRSLFVYEPVILPPHAASTSGANPLAEGALRRRATFADRASAIANFRSKPPMDTFDPAAVEAYVDGGFLPGEDGQLHLACRPEVEAQVYRMGARHDAWDRLPEIATPVVVARGAASAFGPAAVAPGVAARLTQGTLLELPHLGHFGPLEAPAEIARHVTSVL